MPNKIYTVLLKIRFKSFNEHLASQRLNKCHICDVTNKLIVTVNHLIISKLFSFILNV